MGSVVAELDGSEPENFLTIGVCVLLDADVGLVAAEFMLDFLEIGGRAVPLYPVMVEPVLGRGLDVESCDGPVAGIPEGRLGSTGDWFPGLGEGMPWNIFCLIVPAGGGWASNLGDELVRGAGSG